MANVLHSILTFLIYFFSALGVIIVMVITHEFGHFIAARRAGVKTPEFFVGFGPRIWSFRRGDTEYGIKWFLIGGYVKVLGMNPEEEISAEDFPHSYKGVSYAKRFWIIISGSLVHLILAVLIAFLTIWLIGTPFATNTVSEVAENIEYQTPAYKAGLEPGDTILSINGESIGDWEELRSYIVNHPGQNVDLVIRRGSEVNSKNGVELATLDNGNGYLGVVPQIDIYSFFLKQWLIGRSPFTNPIVEVAEKYSVISPAYISGVKPGDTILALNGETISSWEEARSYLIDHPGQEVSLTIGREGQVIELTAQLATLDNGNGYLGAGPQFEMENYSFIQSFKETGKWWAQYSWGVFYSFYRVFNWSTLKQLIGLSKPTSERPVSVVGISRLAGQLANQGLYYFLNFMAFLLLFLAYINLLPLPPLDGGHLLVIALEKLRGKEIDIRKLYPVAVAVLALFGFLFIRTFWLDIFNPINLP